MRSKILLAAIFVILSAQALFAAAPTITSFSPAKGPVGTLVTITGTNLGSPTAFTIAGVPAIVVSNTGTQLVGLVMPGATTGVVSVTAGGSTANSTNKFTVTPTSYPHVPQGAPLVGTNGVGQPYQGNAVAISADGNTAVVAGYNDNSNQGAGWFYTRTGGVWTQQGAKVVAADPSTGFGAYFGTSVAISADGNTAAFGGPDDHTGTGAVFVFTRTAGVWTQQGAKLVGTGAIANNGNPEGNAQQGYAVALSADGNTLLEGGWFDNGGIGAAWVFTRTAGTWAQQGNKIVASNVSGNAYFGRAVSLSADGNIAAIDGPANNAVWFYTRSGGTWTQGSELTGTGGFGFPVALSADGSTAIMGATGDNGPLGAAWIYTRSGTAWPQANGIKLVGTGGSNVSYGSTEGSAVALSADGNTAVIGGNTDGENAGAIWVFTRSGGVWTQQGNKFNATGNGIFSSAQQGSSAAISSDGTTLIEGGPENNTNYGFAAVFTPTLPGVTTEAATNISATGVNLNGLASANGIPANVSFEYGTSPTLSGSTVTTTFVSGSNPMAANASNVSFASNVTGLNPSTTYYFRVDATDIDGTVQGSILSFTTSAAVLLPETIMFPPLAPVTYGYLRQDPGATSTNTTIPITYTSSNPAVAIITGGKIQVVGVGTTTITASQAGNASYSAATPVSQDFTVNPAPLTITPYDETTVYQAGIPPLPVNYSSFVNGDTQASLTTQPTVTTTATVTSVAGTYPITASGAVDPNYTISYTPGTLTVSAVPPTVATQAATSVSATGATLNGAVSDGGAPTTVEFLFGTDSHLSGAGIVAVTTGTSPIPAGTGTVAFTGVVSGLTPGATYYYEIIGANSTGALGGGVLSFTTTSSPISVISFTAPSSAVYGSADLSPNGTSNNTGAAITYTSSNTGVATISDDGKIHVVSAGTTQITASQAAGGGFTAANPVTLTFTVTPAPLTVTAFNTTKVYGSVNPNLAYHSSGFVNGDDSTRLNPQVSISTTATTSSGVGNYAITVSGAADPNYTITFVPGNLKVTAAPLTITADNKTRVQGAVNPQLTVTYTGFVNNDTGDNLSTQPTISTTATTDSGTGTYPITVSGASDPNYTIIYVAGTLTVTPQFAFNPIPPKTYGDPDFNPGATGTNVTYSSGNTGIATIVEGKVHITGAGTTTITATSGESSLQQTLVVNPAPLNVTATDQTKAYGAPNPALTVTYSGFVYSDNAASLTTAPTISTTAIATSNVGSYPITASGAVDVNYTITYAAGTLTITKAAQTIDFAAIPNQLVNNKYDLSGVTASSGLPVSFRLSDPGIAAINGTTLTSLQVGNETVTASQAGNGNYLPAPDIENSFSIQDDNGNDVVVNPVVSPNGDGIDDILNIKGIENYPDNKLTLVNRNGVMIFQMTNYNNTTRVFDGHSSVTGVFQQQGTLLYILEYKVNGEIKRKTGFTVLRY